MKSRRSFLEMLPAAVVGLGLGSVPVAAAVRVVPDGGGRRGEPARRGGPGRTVGGGRTDGEGRTGGEGPTDGGGRTGGPGGGHPDPRPGIDASKIPPGEALEEWPRAVEVFDRIREIPEIVDGIACQCGCRDNPDYYSFLSCFEGEEPMARWCPGCQKLGRFVADLADEGKSLDEIRDAVDARF